MDSGRTIIKGLVQISLKVTQMDRHLKKAGEQNGQKCYKCVYGRMREQIKQ